MFVQFFCASEKRIEIRVKTTTERLVKNAFVTLRCERCERLIFPDRFKKSRPLRAGLEAANISEHEAASRRNERGY